MDLRTLCLAMSFAATARGAPQISANLLRNPDFAEGVDAKGIPIGWSLYAGGGRESRISVVAPEKDGAKAILLEDGDTAAEIGVLQSVAAEEGIAYEASVEIRAIEGASPAGAYLQLRFLPSNRLFQGGFDGARPGAFARVAAKGMAPPGTKHATVYLYTHRDPTPKLLLRRARLISGVDPPPPPPPPPIPPVYAKLKDLHIETDIVKGGEANAIIIVPAAGLYRDEAERIRDAIERRTGVRLPIAADTSPAGAVPIAGHRIVLGNRSTSRTIGELYDRHYTLLDLRYPGPGGSVARSLHSPFGDGNNVLLVGGSDPTGVRRAADRFIERIDEARASAGELSIGRLADLRLGDGLRVPDDPRAFEIWDASKGYGSTGYFGWNSISKRMALYYMTGQEIHAREFLRLAFPDAEARAEIAAVDGERIEDKDAPLSGPYHYNAHLMILYWDLIEESPVFSDEDRLRVTNAFAKQLDHRKGEGIYGRTKGRGLVGSRHDQWSAISLYCLGRYFRKDYPDPIWRHCVESANLAFESLHRHAWVSGENDNLFWYSTAIAPVFTYLILTGDREPVRNGVLAALLRGQEILISGREPDWALNSASIGFLHKAAYLMQDGRYVLYRERTGVDVTGFRLGQSFWPEEHLAPVPPDDLRGTWSIHELPRPLWEARRSGLAFEESFQFASFRDASDASGDFILIDGLNGASRNPYHAFAILELRIGGFTLLSGYRNQLMTRLDGLVQPEVAMDAALSARDVLGSTAFAVAEVPKAPFCRWRRTLVQRIGRHAIIADDLAFRSGGDAVDVEIQWESERGARILPCDPMTAIVDGRVTSMAWVGPVDAGSRRTFFSLLGIEPDEKTRSLDCLRISETSAALALPAPAIVAMGPFRFGEADLAVVETGHLFARALSRFSSTGGETLLSASAPIDVDWDFETGTLQVVAREGARIRAASRTLSLPPGRHTIEDARPDAALLDALRGELRDLLAGARARCARAPAAAAGKGTPAAPSLTVAMTANIGEPIADLVAVPSPAGDRIYAAAGRTIHALSPAGETIGTFAADGAIRMLRSWPEHDLLLAGCADEKVIAFDTAGRRKWVFTSEMDPAVFRAAKTYWFKSAPGHEGIHGLFTGTFLDGKSQAFVGSACTLEILDEKGALIRRMPQFWGKVSDFAIIDGPDGSLNLLASRKYNGTNTVAIINNRTLDPNPRGFHTVPPGSTYMPGWSSMNRRHLLYEDLDGDGAKEVVSEINGTWNRVTVWSADGRALHDASFGPGERIPAVNMRDLAIADLDGDGRKEILAATSRGMIVALDAECRKVWARRLESPPVVMEAVRANAAGAPWIVIGCEDGTVLALDGRGERIRVGRVTGRPAGIEILPAGTGHPDPLVLLATERGEIRGFAVRARARTTSHCQGEPCGRACRANAFRETPFRDPRDDRAQICAGFGRED
ncbi:MAG: VCBS repeat-containing protein, partial [Planctomycetes bacterium]|nr:VCBS repeat-containing protein [Planctomycetota bacterium]